MKHTYSKSAPTGRIETDEDGNYLTTSEYTDHGDTRTESRTICGQLESNNKRLSRLIDSFVEMIARIK